MSKRVEQRRPDSAPWRSIFGIAAAGAVLLSPACSTDSGRPAAATDGVTSLATTTTLAATTSVAAAPVITPITPGTSWQWQLTGTIDETVLDAVANPKKMYDIDLFTTPVETIRRLHDKGITVICYMETGGWEQYRPDAAGYPKVMLGNVLEGYPAERFVDIRRTDLLLPIVTARLDLAESKGCDGIEPDLDDTYSGYDTGFPLTMQDQLAFNRMVADAAHSRGLSIGLKNGASADGAFERAMAEFTDWALNEECNAFDECAGYAAFIAQGKAVFQVEYMRPEGTTTGDFCPADNAAGFDGLLKESSDTLGALPREACRFE